MNQEVPRYYVPAQSYWPLLGAIGLFITVLGIVNVIHEHSTGYFLLITGTLIVAFMMFGWFYSVIKEDQQGLYSEQLDRSFRWAMVWFIFSEVMFFSAFFGALFYARAWSVPWLGGFGDKGSSHLLWESFHAAWPLLVNPDPSRFPGPHQVIPAWGIPAVNTLILLTSGATLTWAHHALKKDKRGQLALGVFITLILGVCFLILQAQEYWEAYTHMNLKLNTGIYGTTFFMLTGFHGVHVTIGTIMLAVMLARCLRGHFNSGKHFAFEATAWYWHFVDVVWLLLFIFVYWL